MLKFKMLKFDFVHSFEHCKDKPIFGYTMKKLLTMQKINC